jgi:hypothetical protein
MQPSTAPTTDGNVHRAPDPDWSLPPVPLDFERAKPRRDVEAAMAAALAVRADEVADRARLARHGGLRFITGGLA